MLKRMTALLIVVSVMLSACVIHAEQESYSGLEEKQALLTALDIIVPDSYGQIDNSEAVTRIDFAALAGKIIGVNPTLVGDDSYYIDVDGGHWASYTLNTLVDRGILHVGDDRLFHPYDTISVNEAVKILVSVLGYGDYAYYKGGYPIGYITAASELNLLNGVKAGGETPVTKAVMTVLLYNAMHAKVMDVVGVGTQTMISNEDTDIMMKKYLNIDYVEGVLNGTEGFTLTEKKVETGKSLVGDVLIENGDIKTIAKLGHSVRAYYYAEDGDEENKTLRFMTDTRGTEELVVVDEDIVSYANGALTYLDESGRKTTASLASNMTVMRNGEVVSGNLAEAFDVKNGQIKLIRNSKSSDINVAVIEDYRTVVVNTVNTETLVITDDIEKNYIDLSGDACEQISVFTAEGDKKSLASIQANSVIDVAYSAKHTIIYTNVQNITGTVNSIDSGAREVDIDGNIYPYSDTLFDNYACKLGAKGLFKTNKRGRVVCMLDPALSDQTGYVIETGVKSSMDTSVQMKLLTAEGTFKVFNISSKAKIDGHKASDIRNLPEAASKFIGKPILYRANTDDEITYIDSPTKNEPLEDENTLQYTESTDQETLVQRWNPDQSKFGKTGLVSSDAVVFRVPADTTDTDERSYSITTKALFQANTGYTTDLYKVGKTSYNNIVVLRMSSYDLRDVTPYVWVKSVSKAVDANGEPVVRIKAYKQGGLVEYDIDASYNIIPDVGDIVRVGTNEKRASRMVEIHYDYSENGSGPMDPEAPFGSYNYKVMTYWNRFIDMYHINRFLAGSAVEIEGNLLKWSIDGHGTDTISEIGVIDSGVPIIVYDAQTEEFSAGSLADVKPSKIYGSECSDIMATTRSGKINTLYVINNRTDY
ncbi:MAG: hypothetical protein HFI90_07340 [Clostridia bacterium]|nr:hypothetical protein [Clostridia bacterium]